VACAACGDIPGTDNQVVPAPTGSGAGSSGVTTVDAGVLLFGRVCVRESLFLATCQTNLSNVQVAVGTSTVTTAADGTFVVTTPVVGTSPVFTVSGPTLVTTSQALNARAQINVLKQAAFNEMLTLNQVVQPVNTGSVIATVTNPAGIPVSGVTAVSTPMGVLGPFFDGSQPQPWVTNATGAAGIVWFPGIMVGPAELSFNTLTGGEAIVGGVQVINGGITMVETPLP
jgi:hypothetical protein